MLWVIEYGRGSICVCLGPRPPEAGTVCLCPLQHSLQQFPYQRQESCLDEDLNDDSLHHFPRPDPIKEWVGVRTSRRKTQNQRTTRLFFKPVTLEAVWGTAVDNWIPAPHTLTPHIIHTTHTIHTYISYTYTSHTIYTTHTTHYKHYTHHIPYTPHTHLICYTHHT